ncbi:hypothetical protein G7072_04670 [Nocardioides sp. HDW12B]|uniref:hypothetical protein n=1 Tax=Nocardioides sp. HDW12B TaxID=2714939 RepID=UPI00140C5A97|nr:hypothetical protein [Nocardioides sp. HDW12B]QIK65728.1 hypothetical protein G7072_04670 [Nocardioides sp. HDW12B]
MSRRPSTAWRIHLGVVVVATVGLLVAGIAHGDSPEADPLTAGFYLVLLLLGMPWSIVLIAAGTAVGGAVDDLPVWSGDVLVVAAAGINLALHHWIRRRRAPAED